MSTQDKHENRKNTSHNKWLVALLVSIAINGLLAGFLIAQAVRPGGIDDQNKDRQTQQKAAQTPSQNPGYRQIRNGEQYSGQASHADPRLLVRALPKERRKEVMRIAMKNLNLKKTDHPRHIFRQLRKAKAELMQVLRTENIEEEIDMVAVENSLAKIRVLNQKLAESGDALMLEVFTQLTPEERKTALSAWWDKKPRPRKRFKRRHRN